MVRRRASLPMELIENERNRKITFRKRTKGLLKKAYELSTLCDVQVCLIMYENNGQLSHHQAPAETFPENPEEVKNIIHKYKSSDSKKRRVQGLADYYANQTKQMNKEIEKLSKDSLETLFPTWDDRLDEFSLEQLLDLLHKLEIRIDTAHKWYNNKLMANQQCADAALMHDSMPPTGLHPDSQTLALGQSSGNGSMMMVNENGGLSWMEHNTEYAPPQNAFMFKDTAAASTSSTMWENPEIYLFGNHINVHPVQYGNMEHDHKAMTLYNPYGSSSSSASAPSNVAPAYDQRLPLIPQPSSYVQYCPPMLASASSSQYQQGLPPLTIEPSHHNMQNIPIKTSAAAAASSQSHSQSYDDDDDDQVRMFYDRLDSMWMNFK